MCMNFSVTIIYRTIRHQNFPEGSETGTWYSAAEVLEMLQARYGKASLKGYSPEKVGNCLSSRHFSFESEHKRKGNCYLMVEV